MHPSTHRDDSPLRPSPLGVLPPRLYYYYFFSELSPSTFPPPRAQAHTNLLSQLISAPNRRAGNSTPECLSTWESCRAPRAFGSVWLPQELCRGAGQSPALSAAPGRGSTHLIIWGTVTLEFSSKAFIMRPLQRMLSTHWKRHGWEVGEGGGGEGSPAARLAWTHHKRARAWSYPDKAHPRWLHLPCLTGDQGWECTAGKGKSFCLKIGAS